MIKSNIKMTPFFFPFSQAQLHSQVPSLLLPQAAGAGGEWELGSVPDSSSLLLLLLMLFLCCSAGSSMACSPSG